MQSNKNHPIIDVSIVTFNSKKWLDNFFNSLLSQDYPLEKVMIWVRDNGSTDGTVEHLRTLQKLNHSFNGFEIDCGENIGFGCGHNSNIAKGSAFYILVTNVDLTLEANSLEYVINQANNDQGAVASWEFRQKPYEHPKYYNPVTLETTWSSSACILFKRTAFESVGGYEPRIFLYGEDVELSYRLRDSGYILKYCPSAVCWHHTYLTENELKPLQILGSTLANCYIRMRYGSFLEILAIPLNLLFLVMLPQRFHGQRIGHINNIINLIKNTPYFLRSRKKSLLNFPIRGMDYEKVRIGAFYKNKEIAENKPLVSIIIRTYDGRISCLTEAVTSVLNQTYDNIELIVIEDGTNTSESYVDEISGLNKLTTVRYISIPKGGRCKAGNAGLANATGQYINFLDDDDLLFADHVEVLVLCALDNPQINAAYSIAWEVRTEVVSKEKWQYRELSYEVSYQENYSKGLLLIINYIPIQSILFKRELYEKYGGFNEKLLVLEDWELWLKYAVESEFLLVHKLTSLYRVPSNNKNALARWKELRSSYQDVIFETNSMKMETTVGELRKMAEIMATRTYLFKIKREKLNAFLSKLPFISIIYRPTRRLYKFLSTMVVPIFKKILPR